MVRSLTLLALLALATVFARETNPVSRVSFTEFGHLVLEVLSPNGTVKECEVYADRFVLYIMKFFLKKKRTFLCYFLLSFQFLYLVL